MHKKLTKMICVAAPFVAASCLLFGCEPQPPKAETAKTSASAKPAKQSAGSGVISGVVAETMNSGGYTYVLVEKAGAPTWVSIPETTVAKGQEISLAQGMVMKNFTSTTLNRTFDAIVFSPGLAGADAKADTQQAGPSMMAKGAMSSMHGSGGATAAIDFTQIKVEKAVGENAFTVAELHAKHKELAGKTVVIKGVVVKVLNNIMQRSWIHVQDGTGSLDDNSFDLTVTSDISPEVGKTVLVEGVVGSERDFGAGYRYDVILEQAVFK